MPNNTEILKYVSLFSGVGGFEQALNRFDTQCVLSSEIDSFANKAYENLYGEKTVGDITKVETTIIPDHNLLVGGFPCQSFSISGKRLGFADKARGTLFFEIARIVKEKKPKYLLLENVKGLIGHDKGNTLNTIIETLDSLGYTIDFTILNSKFYNVAQNRERLYILAIRNDLVVPEDWLIEGNNVLSKAKRRLQLQGIHTFNFQWIYPNKVMKKIEDILEENVDEKYYISEEKAKKLIRIPRTATDNGIRKIGYIEKDKQQNRVHSIEGIMPTITANNQGGRRPGGLIYLPTNTGYRIRKLTPLECFRLQAFPDDVYYKLRELHFSDSQLYKLAGNAVTVTVVEMIIQQLFILIEKEREVMELFG